MTREGSLDWYSYHRIRHYIAAPFCGQILADLGAEVIKLERPGGEAAHEFGPFYNGGSLYYTAYNRNKLGMTRNLKTEEGKQAFRELAATADVIVHVHHKMRRSAAYRNTAKAFRHTC